MAKVEELFENSYDQRSFCRWVIEATEKYFQDPEVQRRFREWKKKKEAEAS